MIEQEMKRIVAEVNRQADPEQMRPLYEAVRQYAASTGDERVLWFVVGQGGADDWNAIFENYVRDGDQGACAHINLSTPQEDRFGGEVRYVSNRADDVLGSYSRIAAGIKTAVIFDNSVRTHRTMGGAIWYVAGTRIGGYLDRIATAATRDSTGCTSFTRYPLYPTGGNVGAKRYFMDHAPRATASLGDRIELIEDGVIWEGELPSSTLPTAAQPPRRTLKDDVGSLAGLAGTAGIVVRSFFDRLMKRDQPGFESAIREAARAYDILNDSP